MQANTDEMDRANHTDGTKWLLPAYVADKPHQPKYSQVSILDSDPDLDAMKLENITCFTLILIPTLTSQK